MEKFHLKESHIGSIVARSKVFTTIKTRQGEPLPFTFHLATLTYVGCELLNLGLSFRNVDPILYQLHSSVNFQKWAEIIRSEGIVILISKERIRPDITGGYGFETDTKAKVSIPLLDMFLEGRPFKERATRLYITFVHRNRLSKVRYHARPLDSMEAYIIIDLPAVLRALESVMR